MLYLNQKTPKHLTVVTNIFDNKITLFLPVNSKRSLVDTKLLKKLQENWHLFYVLGNSKPRLTLKYEVDKEFINLLSELCLNLTESDVLLLEVF